MILIAIALFAALAYAVTRGGTGSTNVLDTEKARLVAGEIIDYGTGLRPVIDRMMLMTGVQDTDTPAGVGILFSAPDSPSAPAKRELFNAAGGKAPYQTPPAEACLSTCAYIFTGQITVTGVGDDAKPELSMILVNIPQKLCEMINNTEGLGTAIPAGDELATIAPFDGTNYGATTAVTLAGGHRSFCYQESTGASRYIYVNVVRAR